MIHDTRIPFGFIKVEVTCDLQSPIRGGAGGGREKEVGVRNCENKWVNVMLKDVFLPSLITWCVLEFLSIEIDMIGVQWFLKNLNAIL